MHTEHITFALGGALVHLESLVSDLRENRLGSDDAPELAVELGHILDHICDAWNTREMTAEQIAARSHEDFLRHTDTVPNFQGSRILGDYA